MDMHLIQKEVHRTAVQKGWWETQRRFPEVVALCHSELSEALEAYRNDAPLFYMDGMKPEGVAVEMADCIIRILDWFDQMNIEADEILWAKHSYNTHRDYRHGGKKA